MLAAQYFDDRLGVVSRVERVARQVRDGRRYDAAVHGHQVRQQPSSERPLINETEGGPIVEQRRDPHVVGARHLTQQHLPAHAEMYDERGVSPSFIGRPVEGEPQVLTAAVGAGDPGAQQPRRQIRRAGLVAAHSARMVHSHCGDRLAGDLSLQTAPHHLDFG